MLHSLEPDLGSSRKVLVAQHNSSGTIVRVRAGPSPKFHTNGQKCDGPFSLQAAFPPPQFARRRSRVTYRRAGASQTTSTWQVPAVHCRRLSALTVGPAYHATSAIACPHIPTDRPRRYRVREPDEGNVRRASSHPDLWPPGLPRRRPGHRAGRPVPNVPRLFRRRGDGDRRRLPPVWGLYGGKRETGSGRRVAARSGRELGTGNWQLGTGNWELGTEAASCRCVLGSLRLVAAASSSKHQHAAVGERLAAASSKQPPFPSPASRLPLPPKSRRPVPAPAIPVAPAAFGVHHSA